MKLVLLVNYNQKFVVSISGVKHGCFCQEWLNISVQKASVPGCLKTLLGGLTPKEIYLLIRFKIIDQHDALFNSKSFHDFVDLHEGKVLLPV